MDANRSILLSKHRLYKIASIQHGYFTSKQAIRSGYANNNHSYHVKNKSWLKVSAGLFRLGGFPDSMESDFTRWCLWSRNQQDQPQGVISHDSALALYGVHEYIPSKIHMTVSDGFRKKTPAEIVLHKASLPISVIEAKDGFIVTRLGQTLCDMRPKLKANGQWDGVIEKVLAEDRLSAEEIAKLGLSEETQESSRSISQNLDPISRGVWKMIFERSEKSRNRSRAGFTLVELLVVMAVISILAAMLMPALGKAVGSARTIACAGNVKQLQFAAISYTEDHNSYVVAVHDSGPFHWWAKSLGVSYLDMPSTDYWRYCKKYMPGTVLDCPASDIAGPNSDPWHDYGINVNPYRFLKHGDWNTAVEDGFHFKLSLFPNASKAIGVTDSSAWHSNYWYYPWESQETSALFYGMRHSNKDALNCGFYDGHVSIIYYETLSKELFVPTGFGN